MCSPAIPPVPSASPWPPPKRAAPRAPWLSLWTSGAPVGRAGGAFCDLAFDPDGALRFWLGDALEAGARPAGHRLDALRQDVRPPAAALQALLADPPVAGRLPALFLGRIPPGSRTLQWATLGQPLIVTCPPVSAPRLLEAPGPPGDGRGEGPPGQSSLSLGPGEVLLVGSARMIMATSAAGEPFGLDRLLRTLALVADEPAPIIGRQLAVAVAAFAGVAPAGQAMIVIKGVPA